MTTSSTGRVFVYPYADGSSSAAAIAQALGDQLGQRVLRISRDERRSNYVGKEGHTVVNWGASSLPSRVASAGRVLNPPEAVARASNKLNFFRSIAALPENERPRVPMWTTSKDEAEAWLRTDDSVRMLFARTVLNGHSGEGIQIITEPGQLRDLRDGTLLVAYVPKRMEFRVHMTARSTEPFLLVQKVARAGTTPSNFQIRSHDNGFVFQRSNVRLPSEDAFEQCRKTLVALGLDFGAVDLIYNERRNLSYVLEVNTAPGMEGSTAFSYATAIRSQLLGATW